MKYKVYKTDVFEEQFHKTLLYLADKYGQDIAIEKLDEFQTRFSLLEENPLLGSSPKYLSLKRQNFRTLIVDKNIIFYKVDEKNKMIILYSMFDYRRDYINIINGI